MLPHIKAFCIVVLFSLAFVPVVKAQTAEEQKRAEMIALLKELMEKKEAAEKASGKSSMSSSKGKSLKSASWKEKEKPKADTEKQAGAEENAEGEDGPLSRPLTPEEQLWKKYKTLAEENKKQAQIVAKKAEEDKEPEEELQEEKPETETAEEEKKPEDSFGIMSILKKYKEANKNKGGLNSKSFGRDDRDERPEKEQQEEDLEKELEEEFESEWEE